MIKIALISFLSHSINIRSLSSYLKQKGFDVICLFCPDDYNEKNLADLIRVLKRENIGFVGISLVTDDFWRAVTATQAIKRNLGIPVIWGGAHVNVLPDESLQYADMICVGEGEEALLELVENISTRSVPDTTIRNVYFRNDQGIIRNEIRPLEENLDKYPIPDLDLTSQYVMDQYRLEKLSELPTCNEYSVMTSRGCPYACSYCYNSYRRKVYANKGKYLRFRSVENVIDELCQANKIFKNLKGISFWDDSFVARSLKEIELFKDLYKKHINLPFFALIEPMAFNYEKIKILKEAGLSALQVGIQTGSERINKDIYKRPVSNKKVIEVAESINKLGISVKYDLIFNNPYEKREDVLETIKLLLEFPKPFSIQGYNLIFYPRTSLTEKALMDGFVTRTDNNKNFSTIQAASNSPLACSGRSEISERYYKIKYDSKEKEYLNSLISLMAFRRAPRRLVRYLYTSETFFGKIILKAAIKFFAWGALIKSHIKRISA
jgi:radical SAM superfamily enzyme YgiQ (UPF0313 family)